MVGPAQACDQGAISFEYSSTVMTATVHLSPLRDPRVKQTGTFPRALVTIVPRPTPLHCREYVVNLHINKKFDGVVYLQHPFQRHTAKKKRH